MPIFKVHCSYFIEAKDKEDAEEQVIDEIVEGEFSENHILVEYANKWELKKIEEGTEEVYNLNN